MTDCAVAENTVISEKTSLKNCILGPNCNVKPKTRISNSVLMNGVVIEDRYIVYIYIWCYLIDYFILWCMFCFSVVIENCIICDKATIRTRSVLKNCLIGSNFDVAEGTLKDKVHLTNADGYMEIEWMKMKKWQNYQYFLSIWNKSKLRKIKSMFLFNFVLRWEKRWNFTTFVAIIIVSHIIQLQVVHIQAIINPVLANCILYLLI